MIDFATVLLGFKVWADAQSGWTSIWGRQRRNPRLNLPYITLFISSISKIGHDSLLPPDELTGGIKVVGDRDVTLLIQFFGDSYISAMNKAEVLRSSLERSTVRDTLADSGIVFVDDLDLQNISELIDSEYEDRASLDLLFRLNSVIGSDDNIVGIIENVYMEGTHKLGDDTISTDLITITTP